MKVDVFGSRNFNSTNLFLHAKNIAEEKGIFITELVCGNAKGGDTIGRKYAEWKGIPITYFNPDWEKYGRSAGFKRNKEKADYAEAGIGLWDGLSKGTKNSIDLFIKSGKPLIVLELNGDDYKIWTRNI